MTVRRIPAAGALVVVGGDHGAEVQLGQGGGAEGALQRAAILGADWYRRVEQRPQSTASGSA